MEGFSPSAEQVDAKCVTPKAILDKSKLVVKPIPCLITNVKEIIKFNDESVGCLMVKPAHFLKQRNLTGIKLTVQKNLFCNGYCMEGRPHAVKKVLESVSQYYKCLMENEKEVKYSQILFSSFHSPVCSIEKIAELKENLIKMYMVSSSFSLVSSKQPDNTTISQAFLRVSQNHVVTVKIVVGSLSAQKTDAIVIPTGTTVAENIYPIELPNLHTQSFWDDTCGTLYNSQKLFKLCDVGIMDGGKLHCSYIIHIIYPKKNSDFSSSCKSDFISNCLSIASEKRIGSVSFPEISSQMVLPLISSVQSISPPSTLHTVSIVIGSKQKAHLYANVLENRVTANSVSRNPSLLLLSSQFKEFVWSWRNDRGAFVPYSKKATDLLNQAYQRDPNSECLLNIDHVQYSIKFNSMMQCNTSSIFERKVIKSPKITSEQSIVWMYCDDCGVYSPYGPDDSIQIESMYQRKETLQCITIGSHTYSFDFSAMKQVNIFSKFSRNITRDVMPGITRHLVFLRDGEVIVNLKGPSRNIQNAKGYIRDHLKKELSSKVIPLPSPLPSVLLRNLEAVAKKHSFVKCNVIEQGATLAQVFQVEGKEGLVQNALTELQGVIISYNPAGPKVALKCQYPRNWERMADTEQCKLVFLLKKSSEFVLIQSKFMKTMAGHKVLQIQRVQNKWIWDSYSHTKRRMHEKNYGRVNEKKLFHGSRHTVAKTICESEEGFDMRYSREGLWGAANYFAEKARYSDTYAYCDILHCYKEMMLAQVLTGESFSSAPDKTLKMPPIKSCPGKDFKVRYDSVNGITRDCRIYMTYCNVNAYPAYIITYRVTGAYSNTPIQPNPPPVMRIPQIVTPQMQPQQRPSQPPPLPPLQSPPPHNDCAIS